MAGLGAKTLCSLLAPSQLPEKLEQAGLQHYDVIRPSVKAIICGSSIVCVSHGAGNVHVSSLTAAVGKPRGRRDGALLNYSVPYRREIWFHLITAFSEG